MVSRTEKNHEKVKKINKEKNKERREHITSMIIKLVIVIIVLLSIGYISLRYIGNYGLVIKEKSLLYSHLPETFHGLKIVHFTDLHYGSTVDKKKFESIVKEVNRLDPDLIVFTGDLIDKDCSLTDEDSAIIKELLNKMKANVGKYAVQGNHDKKYFDRIMKDTDFTVLDNSYDLIYKDGYDPILITGIGSSTLKNMDIERAFDYFNTEGCNQDIFTISIMHEPDNVDTIFEHYTPDLVLAGHSHNGQVRLPFTKALAKVNGAKKYYEAQYTFEDTQMFISGGIGTSNYPFRLFNHPSINFFRLRQH